MSKTSRILHTIAICALLAVIASGVYLLSFYEHPVAIVMIFALSSLLGVLWARGVEIMLGIR